VLCLSSLTPHLPVLPVLAGACNVCALRSLIAAAQQQDHLASGDCVVDPVARPNIDPKFPYPVTARFVVPKVSQFNPIDAPVDGYPCLDVAQLAVPLQIEILLIRSEVVADLLLGIIFVHKRIDCDPSFSELIETVV
jgi:hypothetical protein